MAVTREQVAELYVAFFERAPDADGLKYWVEESGLTIEQISQSFFDQPETQAKYPETMDNATYIDTIYQNLFDRSADAAGAVYWASELDSGNISRADMIMAVVNGAKDTETSKDDTILANKTTVGLDFADNSLNDPTQAKDVISGVDATAESVTAAKAKTDGYAGDAANTDMVIGLDDLTLTEADESITGYVNTTKKSYEKGDSVDGGEGDDNFILNLDVATNTVLEPVSVTNFETVTINNTSTGTPTIDVTNHASSMDNLVVNGNGGTLVFGTGATKVAGVQKVITDIELNQSAKSITTINYAPLAIASDEDAMTVDLNSTERQGLTTTAGIETAIIETLAQTGESDKLVSSSQDLIIQGVGAVDTILVNGGANLTLNTVTGVGVIDASKLDGGIINNGLNTSTDSSGNQINNSLISLAGSVFKGGKGNDDIKFQALTSSKIFGNEGDDTFDLIATAAVANSKAVTVDGGAGNDLYKTGNNEIVISDTTGENTLEAGSGTIYLTDGTIFETITAETGMGATGYDIDASALKNEFSIDTGAKAVASIATGEGNDTITSNGTVAKISTGKGDDTITVGDGGVTASIITGAGNDTITTGKGDIILLDAGTGSNTLNLGTGSVALKGSFDKINVIDTTKAIDITATNTNVTTKLTITGGKGDDTITTGSGDDVITGGLGKDTLTGGNGKDSFKFTKGDSSLVVGKEDIIADFIVADDTIYTGLVNASGTNFLATTAADVAAADVLFAGAVTGNSPLNYIVDNTAKMLYINYDGDGSTDEVIKFTAITGTIGIADILA
jgi:hypothetical protein